MYEYMYMCDQQKLDVSVLCIGYLLYLAIAHYLTYFLLILCYDSVTY